MKKLCNISLTVIELLLIVLLSLSLVSCNSESDYEKAIKSFNEYKYSETIEYLAESLNKENDSDKDSNIEEQYILLAKAYFNNGEYLKAIRTLVKLQDETNGDKTNEFINELERGYNLLDSQGNNHKSIMVSLENDLYNHKDKRSLYLGNKYGLETIFNNFKFDLKEQYGDLMILEIDKIGNNNRFIIYPKIDSRENTVYDDITLNYKDNELDTFKVEIPISASLKPIIKTYNNNFKLLSYYKEEYEYPNLNLTDKYEVICTYHDNGALASLDRHEQRCLSREESVDIQDNKIRSDEFKDRDYYVEDYRYDYSFSDDGCLLSFEEYSFDKLLRYEELTYNDKGALTHFERINLVNDNPYMPDCEFSYEYNEDGYLIKENTIDPDVFGCYGDYTTYEYNDDYSKVTLYIHTESEDFEDEILEIDINNSN